ncbi:MAG: sensor histidine kinase [Deltaproteobacteria bacterium]|nr:MAG: sensor histidine kinase [Deltaproteobacteria bacterium]
MAERLPPSAPPLPPRARPRPRGWPAWALTWLSILAATVATALMMARLSAEGARAAVEAALADQLVAQAGQADAALRELPVEVLVAMGGDRSAADLSARLDALGAGGGLRGAALLGPDGLVVGNGGRWLPGAAEQDLIDQALAGRPVAGPLYRDRSGELYGTAYHALTGHPGFVVAVEGSAATLGAIDALERDQRRAAVASAALAALLGAVLAALVSGPLSRLGRELSAARPGTPPDAIGEYAVREVRQVAAAARQLLAAIQERDAELQENHRREVERLNRMAAEIAHEVGNPLNAVSLSVERLATMDDVQRRARVVARLREQLAELSTIVDRLRDLTRPLSPDRAMVDLAELVAVVGEEVPGLTVQMEGLDGLRIVTDRAMVAEIIRNLALNAAQAGARRLDVEVASLQPGLLVLSLRDDGPGIPEDQAEQVFSWFHTTRATGSGLGLPHARRVAQALGGRLELVELRPATFLLSLPTS